MQLHEPLAHYSDRKVQEQKSPDLKQANCPLSRWQESETHLNAARGRSPLRGLIHFLFRYCETDADTGAAKSDKNPAQFVLLPSH